MTTTIFRRLSSCRSWMCLPLILLGVWGSASLVQAAGPRLDHVFPAGGCRGESVTITVVGEFPNWPVRVWVDRPGIAFEASEKKGTLQMNVSETASPGLYWFRLTDDSGASEMRPVVVGSQAEMVEQEPNDRSEDISSVDVPVTINGRLERRGDVDAYAVHLRADQTLVASLEANRHLASPMDGVLQVCNSQGFVLDQNDDLRGLDPEIHFRAKTEGDYWVRLFAFPATPNSTIGFAGQANFVYRLTLTTSDFLDHSLPLAVPAKSPTRLRLFGASRGSAEWTLGESQHGQRTLVPVHHDGWAGWLDLPVVDADIFVVDDGSSPESLQVSSPAVVSGRLEEADETDTFRFVARDAQKLVFRIESRALGYALDPVIELIDSAGRVIAKADDVGKSLDPVLTHKFDAAAECRVVVRDLHGRGGPRFVYRMTIEEAVPGFDLTLANGSFAVAVGKTLEVPVTVARKDGFKGAIKVRAVRLPQGVRCEPVTSSGTGDTAKAVKLKFTASGEEVSGPLRIVGTAENEPPVLRTATFEVAGMGRRHRDAWLTVHR